MAGLKVIADRSDTLVSSQESASRVLTHPACQRCLRRVTVNYRNKR